MSAFFMLLSLIGLSWSRLSVPTYQRVYPHVILFDLSANMLQTDISPTRLSRAKFKLHDLLVSNKLSQIGLIAYSSEPFVVSPLTDDGRTINELVTLLNPDLLPVSGNNLSLALQAAHKLLADAGFKSGHILVFTGTAPDAQARSMAHKLAQNGIYVSILPFVERQKLFSKFSAFARAGHGKNLLLSNTNKDLNQWLDLSSQAQTTKSHNAISVWRDQGRWFIIPALVYLLPVFRRDQRLGV